MRSLGSCCLFVTVILPGSFVCSSFAAENVPATSHPFLCADYGGNKICMVNVEGTIEWQVPAERPQDVWRLPNGNILFSYIRGAKEITRDKKVVWAYTSAKPNEIHSCQPLPDGRVLIGELEPCRIIEVDRQGKIAKQIPLETATKKIHGRYRLARKTCAGTYLVAFTSEQLVREYNSDGKVIRVMKTPGGVYGAIRLPNGNTLLACGDGHTLVEVDPDDRIVWQIKEDDLPGNPLRFVAGVQRLPNGNTVIANWGGHGHIGQQPQIVEVTRQKKVVWQVFDYKQFQTISGVMLLDVPGDVTTGAILR